MNGTHKSFELVWIPPCGRSLSPKTNRKSSPEALIQEGLSSPERNLLPRKGLSCRGSSTQPFLLLRYYSRWYLCPCQQQQLPAREHVAQSPGCDVPTPAGAGSLPLVTLRHHAAAGGAPGTPQPPLDTGTGGAEGVLAVRPGRAASGANRCSDASPPHRGADVRFPFGPRLHTLQMHKGSC